MINLQGAFQTFFSSFGVPAYLDGYAIANYAHLVPIAATPPYILFTFPRNDAFTNGIVTAKVWTKNQSFIPLLNILEQIEEAVPVSGTMIELDNGGYVWLSRGSPFIQQMPLPEKDQLYKVGYINLTCRSYII